MIRGLGRTSIQNSRKKAPKTQTQITNSGKTWAGEWGAAGECDGRKNVQPCVPGSSQAKPGLHTHVTLLSAQPNLHPPGPEGQQERGTEGQGQGAGSHMDERGRPPRQCPLQPHRPLLRVLGSEREREPRKDYWDVLWKRLCQQRTFGVLLVIS